MRFGIKNLAWSLGVHTLLVGGIAYFLAHDSGHVEGSAGLAGSSRAQKNVQMNVQMDAPPPETPIEKVRDVEPVQEGLPVEREVDLPKEVKNPRPREIEGQAEAPSSQGQAGTGTTTADRVGDSDRTNRLGLYLQKMVKKIQSNLGPAGFLEFPTRAKLLLDLKRDGHVTKIVVLESSGDAALDRLAIRAVEKSSPFDPWEIDQQVQLPVIFQ